MKKIAGARIVEHREVARATQWLVLEPEEPLAELHAPGDVVAVYVPAVGGRWVRHPYTASSAEDGRLGILYRVIRGGRTTPTMAVMTPGETLRLGGRFGASIGRLVGEAPALVGLSTGTGVGPLLGWARAADRHAVLLTGFREPADIPFADALAALPHTTWLPTLSAPDPGWTGLVGHVTAHLSAAAAALRQAGVDPRAAHWHLVGNGAMVVDARAGLVAAGIAHDRVTMETYHNRGTEPDPAVVTGIVAALR